MHREPRTRANRSALGPICAIGWLALCLGLAPASCLNPFPDDQPSSNADKAPATVAPGPPDPRVEGTPGAPTGSAPGAGGGFDDLPDNSPPESTESPGALDAGVPSGDAGPDAQAAVVR
jgi:hypothetical protein